MKTVLILRHAKSSWKDERLDDHDRPLNKRGKRDAPRMGRLLRSEGLLPDRILSSTAVRALSTAQRVAESSGYDGELTTVAELYLAGPEAYLEAIRAVDDGCASLMLVGHNPDVEELVERLGGRHERMPTAALAVIRFAVERWSEIGEDFGQIVAVWRPKELDD